MKISSSLWALGLHNDCGNYSHTHVWLNYDSILLRSVLCFLCQWESINELNKLLHLEDLRFRENPVLQQESAETSRQLIIARIGNIKVKEINFHCLICWWEMLYYSPHSLPQLMLSLLCRHFTVNFGHFCVSLIHYQQWAHDYWKSIKTELISQQYWSWKVSSVSYNNTVFVHLFSSSVW